MKHKDRTMGHQFSQVPKADIPRSSFNRSHGIKTTFNSAQLIPIFVDEALPADTFNLKLSAFARMATPIFPIMDNIHMDTFFFAVPYRLIWDNWQKFNGEQANPTDTIDYLIPTMTSPSTTGYGDSQIADYMGIPTGIPDLEHNSLHHRAYNLIWNEWFRDQNLQTSAKVDMDDGPDNWAEYPLRKRGKRHDYFTSALPWPQKGDSVLLPLGTTAPVLGIGTPQQTFGTPNIPVYETGGVTSTVYADARDITANTAYVEEDPNNPGYPGIYTDLTNASSASINELRQSFQIQKLLERDARGGTRYTEIIRAHFGVTSPDARLQRPEYLGGGTTNINITPIAQTSETGITTPQGNLSAIGTGSINGHGFTKSFTEHTIIIGLVSVRADLNYQQGLNRMFSRQTKYDLFWPALSHIGEQTILNKEIWAQGSNDLIADEEVFGYQERHAEYRYKPSMITGKFRSNANGTLDSWHLAQDFNSLPVLGSTFITEAPPMDRILAVPSEPDFIFDGYFNLTCARPMPTYATPGLIDHF